MEVKIPDQSADYTYIMILISNALWILEYEHWVIESIYITYFVSLWETTNENSKVPYTAESSTVMEFKFEISKKAIKSRVAG